MTTAWREGTSPLLDVCVSRLRPMSSFVQRLLRPVWVSIRINGLFIYQLYLAFPLCAPSPSNGEKTVAINQPVQMSIIRAHQAANGFYIDNSLQSDARALLRQIMIRIWIEAFFISVRAMPIEWTILELGLQSPYFSAKMVKFSSYDIFCTNRSSLLSGIMLTLLPSQPRCKKLILMY